MAAIVREPREPEYVDEVDGNLETPQISADDFKRALGQSFHDVIDLEGWIEGTDLSSLYARTEAEIRDAVAKEDDLREHVRRMVFPELRTAPRAPKGAGKYEATLEDIRRTHQGLLFNGAVEAVDGTRQLVDTLPVTIVQIGVSIVSYRGNQGAWGQRFFRRDLRVSSSNPAAEALELLRRRGERGGLNQPSRRDTLSELLQRGLMTFAERAVLLDQGTALWRLGHGNPAAYELITGAGLPDLMIEGTRLLRRLVMDHERFLFVASEPRDRLLLTIAQALHPLEYAIVSRLDEMIDKVISRGHYGGWGKATADTTWDGVRLSPEDWIRRFCDEVASRIVVGVFRATSLAPGQVFFAHEDHADVAAQIALADSLLDSHRGFPLLIALADAMCHGVFGSDTLSGPVTTAFAAAGAPFRYFSERTTR